VNPPGRFPPGTILDERYRIIGLVGRGGMGEVYRANDLRLSQSVALKFLPEELSRTCGVAQRDTADLTNSTLRVILRVP
jgi:serine/threonine-protein kinase